jgi:hypothetical protein
MEGDENAGATAGCMDCRHRMEVEINGKKSKIGDRKDMAHVEADVS